MRVALGHTQWKVPIVAGLLPNAVGAPSKLRRWREAAQEDSLWLGRLSRAERTIDLKVPRCGREPHPSLIMAEKEKKVPQKPDRQKRDEDPVGKVYDSADAPARPLRAAILGAGDDLRDRRFAEGG